MRKSFVLGYGLAMLWQFSGSIASAQEGLTPWETFYPNEERDSKAQAAELISQAQHDYGDKSKFTFRSTHPRSVGCVAATFTVDPQLPSRYQTGVFATPGKTYEALVRFSNAGAPANSDHAPDSRGMAVKLFGVPGKKLMSGEADAVTHDFVMLNAGFPARDANEFAGIVHLKTDPKSVVKFLLGNPILRARELKAFNDMTKGNPFNGSSLTSQTFSSVLPYLLKGPQINVPVKFSVRPCSRVAKLPLDGSDAELRNDLQARLKQDEVCFDFAMQFYRENAGLLIEDAMNEWPESVTPLVKFATIHIPKQTFLTDEKYNYCENISMNSWHALPEHRPLGNMNRARKIIYEAISASRHHKNGRDDLRVEPSDLQEWNSLTSPVYSAWKGITLPEVGQ